MEGVLRRAYLIIGFDIELDFFSGQCADPMGVRLAWCRNGASAPGQMRGRGGT